MGLELRPACERCARALAPDAGDAWICSHECTFCTACASELQRQCPNCSGELVRRPRRGALPTARRTLQAHARTTWTGNRGQGTTSCRAYARDHEFSAEAKAPIAGSSDPAFLGDPARWSPEELFAASISACHMLWYLHLCAEAGIVVTGYVDDAQTTLLASGGGDGRITQATLRPRVTIGAGDAGRARALHEEAHALHEEAHARCFIAAVCTVPVTIEAVVVTG